MNEIYPLSYLPINPLQNEPVTFNYDYISHLQSLGITDYFMPSQFASNPFFATVDEFHQNVGLLQTASDSLEKILSYIDTLKSINTPTQEVLEEIGDEINSVINNTSFNGTNLFSQTIQLNDQNLSLSIPLFTPDTDIEKYEEIIKKQQENIFDALKNINFSLPFTQNTNPLNFETLSEMLNTQNLTNVYNTSSITPQTLDLLL